MVALAAIFLSACFGSGGSSAPAPNNVAVVAKDSRVIVTWDMAPGVEYWSWVASGSGVTPQNCSSKPSCSTSVGVTSPLSISGLSNGQTYSFSINGRIDKGPGGAGSVAVEIAPRLAGTTWVAGISPSALIDLRGVAYGSTFVAVGTGGAIYSTTASRTDIAGTNGTVWTSMTNPLATDLNAVNYDGYYGKFLAVGAGGKIISMTPSSSGTWTELTGYTGGQNLLAITNDAAGFIVATGANGTIITSDDGGLTWTVQTSGTPNALNSVVYGYDSNNSKNIFVAVGAGGTILYSTNAITWMAGNSGIASELKSVTYGGFDEASGHGVFVAVGAGGTVLTSPDGVNWAPKTSISAVSTATLNAVTYSPGRRFVAVANNGNIYYSEYYASAGNVAATWTQVAAPPVATPLYAVTTGGLYDFSAVGAAGVNVYAD